MAFPVRQQWSQQVRGGDGRIAEAFGIDLVTVLACAGISIMFIISVSTVINETSFFITPSKKAQYSSFIVESAWSEVNRSLSYKTLKKKRAARFVRLSRFCRIL